MWKALDHTADALLLVEAETWPALLAEATHAFAGWLAGDGDLPADDSERVTREVRAEGAETVDTWVEFWRALHRLWAVEGLLPIEVDLDSESREHWVRGQLTCFPASSLALEDAVDVKAVTWHEARVNQLSSGIWRGTIVLDI